MHPQFGRFMVFFMAASLGLAYMVVTMVGRGLIDLTPAQVMLLIVVSFGLVLVNGAVLMVYMTDLIRDALKEKKTNGKEEDA
jgi:hypothetical protein